MGNLNPNYLRSAIGDCFMDELLFEGTVLENITMGREKATFENVQWAVDNLGLSDFIKKLPNGYNTPIHSQGKHFSKSIVDKLILARSIADKPKLLLVKDAFSSMDQRERERIMDFLTNIENEWTLVVASKDTMWYSKVNRVILSEHGELTELN
jgi:ABC-type multidrug transport system fused ATPase/permease subunit